MVNVITSIRLVVISADILCTNFNVFHNPIVLYMLYCWSVTPWRWSRYSETCRRYEYLCKKCNFKISAFVGFIVQTVVPALLYNLNPLQMKHRLLYLKIQSVRRCKHFLSRLQKPVSLCCKWHKSLFVLI